MLFENNNRGKGNRTVTSDTFLNKYMVNVNAYHREGFYFMILSERGHHVHQTNGRFVYIGLNVDCSHKYGRLHILLHHSRHTIITNCANEFE